MKLNIFDTTAFLQTAGYIGLFFMLYAETGLLIGLILPGESLLFTAGFLSSVGYFHIWIVIIIAFVAAALADSTGYVLGKKYGRAIFSRPNSLFFNQAYIEKSERFYQRHGAKTLIAARFLPYIRTLAPIFAGIGLMEYKTFVKFNLVGALLWSVIVSLLAYFLGQAIPNANHYVILLAIAAVVLFAVPGMVSALSGSRHNKSSK